MRRVLLTSLRRIAIRRINIRDDPRAGERISRGIIVKTAAATAGGYLQLRIPFPWPVRVGDTDECLSMPPAEENARYVNESLINVHLM